MNKKYRVVSLFSGIGGFEEGLKQANIDFEVVFASEIDIFAQNSYISNFGKVNLYGDITAINEKKVPDHDLLLAGFPCQAFSVAGKRLGFEDTRGTLFFDILRIIKEKKPKFILLENVKNLVSHDKSKTINVILKNLSELGYKIDFTVLNSKDFKVAQNRERTYIIGVLDIDQEKYTVDPNKKINKLKMKLNEYNFNSFNFFENISKSNDFNVIADSLNFEEKDLKYFLNKKEVSDYVKSLDIKKTNKGNSIKKLFDIPKDLHNDNERQRRVYSINGISPTVLARADSAKIYLENETIPIRKLTPVENLKLQGFSNEFIKNITSINMSNAQLYKQGGNAVSPPVVAAIFKYLHDKYSENNNEERLKFVDLFSGIGGFRLAMDKAGAECVFSSDIDKYARETYSENFSEEPSGDITKIQAKEIPDHDILTAGFPCQSFSLAGKRLGFEDTRGTLFFDIARILKTKKTPIFILENVSGLVNHDKGNTLTVIEDTLKDLNYKFKWKVLNAKDYGVPQNRNRWYCIGVLKGSKWDKINLDKVFPEKVELKKFLEDLIDVDVSQKYEISDTANRNINLHLNKYLQKNKISHAIIANNIRPSKVSFRSDGISPCLTAKMGTGGNNVPVLVDENRKLTVKECLKLMGFPEDFKIKENYSQSYKQVGNSVVVPIIEDIVNNIFKEINKI